MKILKQFGVIFGVCWVSLVIEHYLPFSFPASVIGMILLLLCLLTGFLKIEHVQEKADFLLGNMAFCGKSLRIVPINSEEYCPHCGCKIEQEHKKIQV